MTPTNPKSGPRETPALSFAQELRQRAEAVWGEHVATSGSDQLGSDIFYRLRKRCLEDPAPLFWAHLERSSKVVAAGVELQLVVRDIDLRKKTLATLYETEERFRQLANNSDEVLWVFELVAERVLYVNPAFERIWGIPAKTLLMDPDAWMRTIIPEDQASIDQAWRHTVATGKTFSIEYRITNRFDQQRWISDTGNVPSAHSRPDGECHV